MVEEVVELKPELQVEPLGKAGVLVKRHVRLDKRRIAELI